MSFDVCISNTSLCGTLPDYVPIARLAERDAAKPAAADQAFLPGIDLNASIFKGSYSSAKLHDIFDLLDSGFRALYMDIWWSDINKQWQLCPAEFPKPNSKTDLGTPTANALVPTSRDFTISEVSFSPDETSHSSSSLAQMTSSEQPTNSRKPAVETVASDGTLVVCDSDLSFNAFTEMYNDYIHKSDTNLAVSLLSLTLRPRLLSSNTTKSSISSIDEAVGTGLRDRAFGPTMLNTSRSLSSVVYLTGTSRWPTLANLLLVYRKRVVTIINTDYLSSEYLNLDNPSNVFVLGNSSLGTFPAVYPFSSRPFADQTVAISDLDSLALQSFRSVSIGGESDGGSGNITADWKKASFEGWSPVLNQTLPSNEVLTSILSISWAWKEGEPMPQTSEIRRTMLESQNLTMCVMQEADGWSVANCNSEKYVICEKKQEFTWEASAEANFFNADCSDRGSFYRPETMLEARSLRQLVASSAINPGWVALNSLTVPNCWVAGNSLSTCPYTTNDQTRDGTSLLAACCTVVFVLFTLIASLEYHGTRIPLRHRNKSKRFANRPLPSAHWLETDGIAG